MKVNKCRVGIIRNVAVVTAKTPAVGICHVQRLRNAMFHKFIRFCAVCPRSR